MSICKEEADQISHLAEELDQLELELQPVTNIIPQDGGTSSRPHNNSNNRTVDEKRVLQGLSVLLVEDHEVLQRIGIAMLRSLGARVTLVEDGQAAVEAVTLMINAARQNQNFQREPNLETSNFPHYDLILMDCQMDNMNGCDATRIIRKLEAEAEMGLNIPIIAFTALVAQDNQQECIDAGMDNFLKKPTKQHLLLASIVETLAKKNHKLSCDHSAEDDQEN